MTILSFVIGILFTVFLYDLVDGVMKKFISLVKLVIEYIR